MRIRQLRLIGLITSISGIFFANAVCAQSPSAASSVSIDYSNSNTGLKDLMKDILKAQKENDSARAGALIDSLVLPNARQWYTENFDAAATGRALPVYESHASSMPAQLARFFLAAQSDGFTNVEIFRFDSDCDDNASEQTFNTLDARLKGVPLFEARFAKGGSFKRLFAFAFVDGKFRFILPPDFSKPEPTAAGPNSSGNSSTGPVDLKSLRVQAVGNVQASKLLNRVNPIYPQIAREEHLAGIVRLHAIIKTDGSVGELYVLEGRCSLAKSAKEAVSKWKYSPTLLEGKPVEVDTTIDVIYTLSR